MTQILGIRFKDYGQTYYFDAGEAQVYRGRQVVVETEQGQGLGTVMDIFDTLPEGVAAESLKPIVRVADDSDLTAAKELQTLSRQAFLFCKRRISERGLDMKLVDVEIYFDKSKFLFYFTAPGRIDFRDLVKDLVREYRSRIELRQIGVRHETQMLGAIGNCGQLCCCRRFLRKFEPVTIKMAKEQNLFLNPNKISGICGRLLCCLAYEQQNYEEFQKLCPKVGKKVLTGAGQVKVLRTNFFRQSITILPEEGQEKELSLEEWTELLERKPPEPGEVPASQPEARAPRQGQRPGGAGQPRQGQSSGRGEDRRQPTDRPERGGPDRNPDRPAPDRPTQDRSAQDRPMQDRPAQDRSAQDKPRGNQPPRRDAAPGVAPLAGQPGIPALPQGAQLQLPMGLPSPADADADQPQVPESLAEGEQNASRRRSGRRRRRRKPKDTAPSTSE